MLNLHVNTPMSNTNGVEINGILYKAWASLRSAPLAVRLLLSLIGERQRAVARKKDYSGDVSVAGAQELAW